MKFPKMPWEKCIMGIARCSFAWKGGYYGKKGTRQISMFALFSPMLPSIDLSYFLLPAIQESHSPTGGAKGRPSHIRNMGENGRIGLKTAVAYFPAKQRVD